MGELHRHAQTSQKDRRVTAPTTLAPNGKAATHSQNQKTHLHELGQPHASEHALSWLGTPPVASHLLSSCGSSETKPRRAKEVHARKHSRQRRTNKKVNCKSSYIMEHRKIRARRFMYMTSANLLLGTCSLGFEHAISCILHLSFSSSKKSARGTCSQTRHDPTLVKRQNKALSETDTVDVCPSF